MLLKISIAMVAFAANSVLCRLALSEGQIDPMSFSAIRVISGAVVLLLLYLFSNSKSVLKWNVKQAIFLSTYIIAFSLAYIHIDAGIGALLLFGAVQMTMVLYGVGHGEKLNVKRSLGLLLALLGIILLLLPGANTPSIGSAFMMIISGVAWAAYSIGGKNMHDPLASTLTNFLLSVPIVMLMSMLFIQNVVINTQGILLAVASGGLASSGAYVLWYAVLSKIDRITASTVQLSVPCLAILGGILFIGESLSLRIVISTIIVLIGIWIVISASSDQSKVETTSL